MSAIQDHCQPLGTHCNALPTAPHHCPQVTSQFTKISPIIAQKGFIPITPPSKEWIVLCFLHVCASFLHWEGFDPSTPPRPPTEHQLSLHLQGHEPDTRIRFIRYDHHPRLFTKHNLVQETSAKDTHIQPQRWTRPCNLCKSTQNQHGLLIKLHSGSLFYFQRFTVRAHEQDFNSQGHLLQGIL